MKILEFIVQVNVTNLYLDFLPNNYPHNKKIVEKSKKVNVRKKKSADAKSIFFCLLNPFSDGIQGFCVDLANAVFLI